MSITVFRWTGFARVELFGKVTTQFQDGWEVSREDAEAETEGMERVSIIKKTVKNSYELAYLLGSLNP